MILPHDWGKAPAARANSQGQEFAMSLGKGGTMGHRPRHLTIYVNILFMWYLVISSLDYINNYVVSIGFWQNYEQ